MAVTGLILTVVLFILAFTFVQQWLKRRLHRLVGKHPAATFESDAADIFEGSVEVIKDEVLSHPASEDRVRQFYEMAPLGWDIIAASAEIERDQQAFLIEQLREAPQSLRFICIVGEAGSGKSTLARRAAADLHRLRMLVLRVKDTEAAEVWYQMPEFCSRTSGPICVLADDLFRNRDVCRAVRELNPWLPLTVLATSQTHEYRPDRLKGEITTFRLGPPSDREKERVLRRLGRHRGELTPLERERLDTANEFLVLMAELTSGKGFEEIIKDSMENLRRSHSHVYRAYEYLCFTYRLEISMPASVIERLDPEGRFHNLPGRPDAKGLIFYHENHPQGLRTGHPRRAETAGDLFEEERSPAAVLREIASAIDSSNPDERRFLGHLLLRLADKRKSVVDEALPDIEHRMSECVSQLRRVYEFAHWRKVYLGLGRTDEANRCLDMALATEPTAAREFNLLPGLYRQRGRERDALPVLARWVRSRSDWGVVGPTYLRLVGLYGTQDDLEQAFAGTTAWLEQHSNDEYVRTAFLGLVERRGTPEQVERVGQEAMKWVREHPEAKNVWARLISYLTAVKRLDDARTLAEEAAEIHSTDSSLLAHYLRLMGPHLDETTARELFERLTTMTPRDSQAQNALARWLHDRGYLDQAREVFESLVRNHPDVSQHHYRYGRLLLDMDRYHEAVEQFEQVLTIHHSRHAMAYDGQACALRGLANLAQQAGNLEQAAGLSAAAERAFRKAIVCARVAGDSHVMFLTHLGWLYTDRKRWRDALDAFSESAATNPDYFGNYWGQGYALFGLEKWDEAAQAIRTALDKAPKLRSPALEDIQTLLKRCEVMLGEDHQHTNSK